MNQLGPWAISQAIDLLSAKTNRDLDETMGDEAFALGRPQRFSVGRIVEDQRRAMRGHIDEITLGPRPVQTGTREAGRCA